MPGPLRQVQDVYLGGWCRHSVSLAALLPIQMYRDLLIVQMSKLLGKRHRACSLQSNHFYLGCHLIATKFMKLYFLLTTEGKKIFSFLIMYVCLTGNASQLPHRIKDHSITCMNRRNSFCSVFMSFNHQLPFNIYATKCNTSSFEGYMLVMWYHIISWYIMYVTLSACLLTRFVPLCYCFKFLISFQWKQLSSCIFTYWYSFFMFPIIIDMPIAKGYDVGEIDRARVWE